MTRIWAHRGASRDAPENTLPAFERAVEQGADGVEFDVQLTADGAVVVIHDETLERTTDGNGAVAATTLDALRRLDASGGRDGFAGARVPTLEEVLDLFAPTRLVVNIELKNSVEPYPGMEEKVLAAIEARAMDDRVVLSTFSQDSLRHLQRLGTTIERALVYSGPLVRPWRLARELGAAAIHPSARFVWGAGFVRRVQAEGLRLRPWVVNDPRQLARMSRWGVDAVFTDEPQRVRALGRPR